MRSTARRQSCKGTNLVQNLHGATAGTSGNKESSATNENDAADGDIELLRSLDEMTAQMNAFIRGELKVPRFDAHGVMQFTCLEDSDVGKQRENPDADEKEDLFDVEKVKNLGWLSLENVLKSFVAETHELHTAR